MVDQRSVHGGFPGDSVMKNPPAHAGDESSILGLGRPLGGENGNPLQYSCLKKIPWTEEPGELVYGVTKRWTELSTHREKRSW